MELPFQLVILRIGRRIPANRPRGHVVAHVQRLTRHLRRRRIDHIVIILRLAHSFPNLLADIAIFHHKPVKLVTLCDAFFGFLVTLGSFSLHRMQSSLERLRLCRQVVQYCQCQPFSCQLRKIFRTDRMHTSRRINKFLVAVSVQIDHPEFPIASRLFAPLIHCAVRHRPDSQKQLIARSILVLHSD